MLQLEIEKACVQVKYLIEKFVPNSTYLDCNFTRWGVTITYSLPGIYPEEFTLYFPMNYLDMTPEEIIAKEKEDTERYEKEQKERQDYYRKYRTPNLIKEIESYHRNLNKLLDEYKELIGEEYKCTT